MACFFCESPYHLTQHCDQYPSDDLRRDFCVKNQICEKSMEPIASHTCDSIVGCTFDNKSGAKCYTCFSIGHNSVFCPQRYGFQFFVPKIDEDLHSRFFQTLDPFEKYSTAFSSQQYMHLLKPKGIVAKWKIDEEDIRRHCQKDFLAGPYVNLESNVFLTSSLEEALASNSYSIRSQYVTIDACKNFSAHFLLQLLSSHTKRLRLKDARLTCPLNPSKFPPKIAKIGEIEFINTNVKIDNSVQRSEISIKASKISLRETQNFSTNFFFHLLTAFTTKLDIQNVTFDSKIKFTKILSKIPNIQEISILDSDIEIEKSWLEDLIKYKKENNISKLVLTLDSVDFDTEKLIELMTTKMIEFSSEVILEIKNIDISASFLDSMLPILMISDMLLIRATNFYLCNIANFQPEILLRFLSSTTKKLICKNSTFDSPIEFSKITSKIPSIEEIEFNVANLKFEKSFADDLLLLSNLKNLKKVSFKIDNFDFDFGKLKEFMMHKIETNLLIFLDIDQTGSFSGPTEGLQEKVDTYFVPFAFTKPNQPTLSIAHTINGPNSPIETNFLCSLP